MQRNGKFRRKYKIIGAYDSETANHTQDRASYPILHQLGLIDCKIEAIGASNVEDHVGIELYRHSSEMYARFDELMQVDFGCIPVIACHNLAFDMYGLSPWLARHDVRVLAKSRRKPLKFEILDESGAVRLVIWDTLTFSGHSLAYMGNECGYAKLTGSWDYDKVRAPATELTDAEIAYAKHDIYALLAWLGYWCRINPDIDTSNLASRVLTKTGVVRCRRVERFGKLKGTGLKQNAGQYYTGVACGESFDTDDELFTTAACTRGGFTFVSSRCASVVYDLDEDMRIYGYDATSQHPAQMVSHAIPCHFRHEKASTVQMAARLILARSIDDVLEHWREPFGVAICAPVTFTNLRPRHTTGPLAGIYPLASARFAGEYRIDDNIAEDNEFAELFREHLHECGYKDSAVNPTYEFGKLKSADVCRVYVTELTLWEIGYWYEWDSMECGDGYLTMRFMTPSDLCTLSVMGFYATKREFKRAMRRYYKSGTIDNADTLRALHVPGFVVDGMLDGTIEDAVVDSTNMGIKADLNSLYGIEASNEYRRDTVMADDGIAYVGSYGVANKPKVPKAHYQFGQRIVGWSRIAQTVVMHLVAPHVLSIVNGDTDSVKMLAHVEKRDAIEQALDAYYIALTKAKARVCSRVRTRYSDHYDDLDGIGAYVLDFETRRYCASWNKAYCSQDEKGMHFTIAGLPGRKIDEVANSMIAKGKDFAYICNTFLGYNVTYAHDLIHLLARRFPEWGSLYYGRVMDYRGDVSTVAEPQSLYLYPMAKTVNDTGSKQNLSNMFIALENNPRISCEPLIIGADGVYRTADILNGEV